MKQILFPTAYTEHSKVAFRYTQKLAQYFDAGITLVHIYETPVPQIGTNAALINEFSNHDRESYADLIWTKQLDKLQEFAKEMEAKQYQDIPLDFITTDGSVVKELLDIDRSNNFDLVVMGMSRKNVFEKIFGHTAFSMIDRVPCPVLLIPPDTHFMGVDKIVYGTAFEFGDKKIIDLLLEWGSAFKAKLNVLHVCSEENEAAASEKIAELKDQYKDGKNANQIDFTLEKGKVINAIESHVTLSGADILAVHRRKQGFWQKIREGSLTKHIAEDIKIPLLVLKS